MDHVESILVLKVTIYCYILVEKTKFPWYSFSTSHILLFTNIKKKKLKIIPKKKNIIKKNSED